MIQATAPPALLGCPFCGSPPDSAGTEHWKTWMIRCVHCDDARVVVEAATEAEAVAKWNRRA